MGIGGGNWGLAGFGFATLLRSAFRVPRSAFLVCAFAHEDFLVVALLVEGEEAGEDFVVGGLGPAVAVGLLAFAGGVFFVFVVEDEFAGGVDVGPAVGGEDGFVHCGVEFSEFEDGGIGFFGVVEAVVGGGEALVVGDHELGAVGVVGFACGFESGIGFPVFGEGEGFKAVGGRVLQIIFQC